MMKIERMKANLRFTLEAINFMATQGRGLICLAKTGESCWISSAAEVA
jgi:hypothetical protein